LVMWIRCSEVEQDFNWDRKGCKRALFSTVIELMGLNIEEFFRESRSWFGAGEKVLEPKT
jgi:hypothetical protein